MTSRRAWPYFVINGFMVGLVVPLLPAMSQAYPADYPGLGYVIGAAVLLVNGAILMFQTVHPAPHGVQKP